MFDSKIIEVYNQNNPTITLLSYPINIYRAPVLMVHGLWGNLNSFKDMEDYLSNSNAYPHTWGSFDNSPLLFRMIMKSLTILVLATILKEYQMGLILFYLMREMKIIPQEKLLS
ncbi:MAG: hypothetical protein IPH33_15485 [Bacteroidetes bacterium]|nr:hypothetical protein [Bacteroidota bacterium]